MKYIVNSEEIKEISSNFSFNVDNMSSESKVSIRTVINEREKISLEFFEPKPAMQSSSFRSG